GLLCRLLLAGTVYRQVLCHQRRFHLFLSAANDRLARTASGPLASVDLANHVRLSPVVDGSDPRWLSPDMVLLVFAGTFCRDNLRPRSLSALSDFHLLLPARSRTFASRRAAGRSQFWVRWLSDQSGRLQRLARECVDVVTADTDCARAVPDTTIFQLPVGSNHHLFTICSDWHRTGLFARRTNSGGVRLVSRIGRQSVESSDRRHGDREAAAISCSISVTLATTVGDAWR